YTATQASQPAYNPPATAQQPAYGTQSYPPAQTNTSIAPTAITQTPVASQTDAAQTATTDGASTASAATPPAAAPNPVPVQANTSLRVVATGFSAPAGLAF